MATDFQRRKMASLFTAMDVDQDGFIEGEDVDALTARWADLRGWEPGTPSYDGMRAIMMAWWAEYLKGADRNGDDKLTFDEAIKLIDHLPMMREQVQATADALFDTIDQDADGRITLEEHKQIVSVFKGTEAGDDEVFSHMDLNGDGNLSREEFRDLWAGFWISDDPNHPGQWIFGPY